MKFLKNSKGFTLIEMVSVILVLGIISAVAIPMFDQSSINATLVADTIQTDIQYTQELAMTRDQNVSIIFANGATSYDLPADPNGVYSSETRQLPQGVNIVGDTTVTFNGSGETSATGSEVNLNAGGVTLKVVVQGYTGRATVPPPAP